MTRTRRAVTARCISTAGSSARSVAMTQSAACAHVEHRAAQRQIGGALQPRARGIGRAEFLQPLRIEHERRRRLCAPPARIAEHAGAEAVHEIDRRRLDELPRDAPGALAEERIRRASVEDRGAAPARQRKRAVGHEPRRDPGWIAPASGAVGGVRVMSVTSMPARARCRTRS